MFFERAHENKDFDPQFERMLNKHRRSASFEAKALNVWATGDFEDEEEGVVD